jgi:hypothetical protein
MWEELFKVGKDGCTVMADSHTTTTPMRTRDWRGSPVVNICPLCSYWSTRHAVQAANVKPTIPTEKTRPRDYIHLRHVKQGDSAQHIEVDNENYHLLRFLREGTPCLLRDPPDNWEQSGIRHGTITVDAEWMYTWNWRIPCAPWARSDPPPPTTQPVAPSEGTVESKMTPPFPTATTTPGVGPGATPSTGGNSRLPTPVGESTIRRGHQPVTYPNGDLLERT